MKVIDPLTPDPRLEALLKASERVPPPDATGVAECPHARRATPPPPPEPKPKKPPIRLLLWNIFELGGGFYRPHQRPEYAAEAYAALIKQLDIDIVVIQGITATIGQLPKEEGEEEKSCLVMDRAVQDTGPAEVDRILKKLKAKDPGSAWEIRFPKVEGKYLYNFGGTTCFIYRTVKSITLSKLDIVNSKNDPKIGLTGKFLCAAFAVPEHREGPFYVVTPLGVPPAERALEKKPEAGPEEDLKPTGALPESYVLAISAPEDLIAERARFSDFKADMDAVFLATGKEGSRLQDEFWKKTVESKDGFLENFLSIDLGDLRKQDGAMHWEALEAPAHAGKTDQVTGYLADALLICHAAETPAAPAMEEMRVVDLIAASMTAERVARLKPKGAVSSPKLPKEDACLVEQREAYRKADIGGYRPEANDANEIGECRYFSLALSRHWPVVAQLRLEP